MTHSKQHASKEKALLLRKHWGDTALSQSSKTATKRLRLNAPAPADLDSNLQPKSQSERFANVAMRIRHLSAVLVVLQRIYKVNRDSLYGDEFLAFVGNCVIRDWPGKDFPFFSKRAHSLVCEFMNGKSLSCSPPTNQEIHAWLKKASRNTNNATNLRRSFVYEHWTPISFFRDVFANFEDLSEEDFFQILSTHYRVVWILKEEDNRLTQAKFRSNRPNGAYENIDIPIEIQDHELWVSLYGQ